MLYSTPKEWKLVAWNGVSLRVPPQWEVSSLATSYLQLDDGMGPVLELKWQQLKGFFSHKAHLKKLARLSRSAAGLHFRETPLPKIWRQALPNFEVQSFVWKGPEISGKGAILYCSACQRATLLQFYQKRGRDESLIPMQVLQSFKDHGEDSRVIWALFGMHALLPERFALVHHRFHPGHYQLEFRCRREQLYLSRWGPADVLLTDGDLLDWFEKGCKEFRWCDAAWLKKHTYDDNLALHGQSQRSDTIALRLWARVTRKLPHFWLRIWHLSGYNQILGVGARGLKPLDKAMLEEMCSNYEMGEAEKTGKR